jgi:N-acetylglucosaminyl-diphospho-decaprenol L-rhamnosyltransferase
MPRAQVLPPMRTSIPVQIPVIIVSFRNARDVNGCVDAIARMAAEPELALFICENGGADAFNDLVAVLTGPGGACDPHSLPFAPIGPRIVRAARLRLQTNDPSKAVWVHVGEACENLGYAGGVNAYLESLLTTDEWPGVWILNPDTEPESDALKELVDYAEKHGRDMVGSRQRPPDEPDIVLGGGLAWRKWRAATKLVGYWTPAKVCPPSDEIERQLDSPSGSSMYVTRTCIERIGLMDETYFLYFEDLDWGIRAKRQGKIGYAHRSVVVHEGGTTIGGGSSRRSNSSLAVYLEFRNRLLFTRNHFPKWIAWTFFMEIVEVMEYARVGSFSAITAAFRGIAAGVAGRTGRPDHLMRFHRPTARTRKPIK